MQAKSQMKTIKSISRAKLVYKIKSFIATLPYHILIMSGVAIISFLFNKWLEAVVFLSTFFSLRYKFPTTYHAKSIIVCMVLTNSIFALSIILCPNITFYVFGGIIFGFIDTFLLWYIQSKQNLKEEKLCACQMVEELSKKVKTYEHPLNTLMEKCRKAKLSKRDTEIAIKYFYDREQPKDIWLWLCENNEYNTIEWDSIYRLLIRIGNKLNIKR